MAKEVIMSRNQHDPYCKACGEPNDSGGKFCSKCRSKQSGKKLFGLPVCLATPPDIDRRTAFLRRRAAKRLPLFDPPPPWIADPAQWSDTEIEKTIEAEIDYVLNAA
jgi:hypothetical protein